MISVDDLFTAGIGFDVVGAVLIGKGLLVSAKQQLRKGVSGFGGYSAGQAVSWAEDWVDAWFGASSLVLGFLLQLIAYALLLGGAGVHAGTRAALVAIGFAGIAVLLVLAAWRLCRRRLIRARAVSLARGFSNDDRPDGYLLTGMARELGRTAQSVEDVPNVLLDVFGVSEYTIRNLDELERVLQSWKEATAESDAAP